MSEEDYAELLDFIIDRLHGVEAFHIIDQIKDLEKISIIEKKRKKKQYVKKGQLNEEQLNFFYEATSYKIDETILRNLDDIKGENDDVSQSFSRQMTYKEMYLATIDMLSTYLITVPKMADLVEKHLIKEFDHPIMWKTEGSKRIDKEIDVKNLESIDTLGKENILEIEQIMRILKENQ